MLPHVACFAQFGAYGGDPAYPAVYSQQQGALHEEQHWRRRTPTIANASCAATAGAPLEQLVASCAAAYCSGAFSELEKCDRKPAYCSAHCERLHRLRAALEDDAAGRSEGRAALKNGGAPWVPLEADSIDGLLHQHPDPLRALQRGTVPAIILRGLVSPGALETMVHRLAAFARYRHRTGDLRHKNFAIGSCTLAQILTEISGDIRPRADTVMPVVPAAQTAQSAKAVAMCDYYNSSKKPARYEWGQKLPLSKGTHAQLMLAAKHSGEAIEAGLTRANCSTANPQRGTRWHDCSPYAALLHGVDALAKATGRRLAVASEPPSAMSSDTPSKSSATSPKANAKSSANGNSNSKAPFDTPHFYIPGMLRLHPPGSSYPLHFDSHLAESWRLLRRLLCSEQPSCNCPGQLPTESFAPLTRHHFSTAVILTLQVSQYIPHRPTSSYTCPYNLLHDAFYLTSAHLTNRVRGCLCLNACAQAADRSKNPSDLRIWRSRWPELLPNCSLRTVNAYAVGARFAAVGASGHDSHALNRFRRATQHVDLRGEPGDMYLFNSEYLHELPTIKGKRWRAVLGGTVGYSSDKGEVMEVWS